METNLPWLVCAKDTVRTDSAGEAQDSACTQTHFSGRNGTNDDHEQPRAVQLVPMLFFSDGHATPMANSKARLIIAR